MRAEIHKQRQIVRDNLKEKYCPNCEQTLSIDNFYRYKSGTFASYCKKCSYKARIKNIKKKQKEFERNNPNGITEKYCVGCETTFPVSEFTKDAASEVDKLSRLCKKCNNLRHIRWMDKIPDYRERKNAYGQQRRDSRRNLVYAYLEKNPCVDCGETNPIVLEFDHIKDKEFCISEGIFTGKTLDSIKKEISKCDIRCANCHAIKTAKEINSYKYRLYMEEQ